MVQISSSCSSADLAKVVSSMGRLSHMNPNDLWAFLRIARSNADNEVFWKSLHDCLVQSGTSVIAADGWISGMKLLAAGRLP